MAARSRRAAKLPSDQTDADLLKWPRLKSFRNKAWQHIHLPQMRSACAAYERETGQDVFADFDKFRQWLTTSFRSSHPALHADAISAYAAAGDPTPMHLAAVAELQTPRGITAAIGRLNAEARKELADMLESQHEAQHFDVLRPQLSVVRTAATLLSSADQMRLAQSLAHSISRQSSESSDLDAYADTDMSDSQPYAISAFDELSVTGLERVDDMLIGGSEEEEQTFTGPADPVIATLYCYEVLSP